MKTLHTRMLICAGGLSLAALGAPANAQALDRGNLSPNDPAVMNPAVEGQGRLTFSSVTQDTGEILDTENAHLSFLFRNTGNGPLTITQVKASCGCTVPEMAKKTYMPGETGTMNVAFDPKGKGGPIARNITIFTDSDLTPNETITVRALVRPVVVTEPRVLPFDVMDKGQSDTKEFKIYGRTDDFKVTRATVDQPGVFDIEVEDMGETKYKGENLRLSIVRVTVRPDAKPDNHRADVTIRTNDERKPIFTLATVARVLGDLQLRPVRVTLGRMMVGDSFERVFTVASKSGKPFEIESAALNTVALDSQVAYEPANEEKTEWNVTVKGVVTNPAPRFNTQLSLTTDVPDEKDLTVQMYGQLRAR